MSILTKEEIFKEIKAGNIEITPFKRDQVGPASIDLHLGHEFCMFKRTYQTVPLNEEASAERKILERRIVKSGDYFLVLPRETVIAVTKDKIKLLATLCGQLDERRSIHPPEIICTNCPGFYSTRCK